MPAKRIHEYKPNELLAYRDSFCRNTNYFFNCHFRTFSGQ